MKRFFKQNVVSLLALLISIVTLALFWCRFEPFTFDVFGATAGVLSILVTILIGFQFYNLFDFNKKKKEIDTQVEVMRVQLIQTNFQTHLALLMVFYDLKNAYEVAHHGLSACYYALISNNIEGSISVMNAANQVCSNEIYLTRSEQSKLLSFVKDIEKVASIKEVKDLELKILGAIIVEKSYYSEFS